jgi:ribonuclease P protein component
MASPLLHPRAGIIVPKGGRTTIDRNRVKRRLRELIRLYLLPAAESVDLVVRARDEAYSASFEDLRLDLMKAADLIGQAFRKGM